MIAGETQYLLSDHLGDTDEYDDFLFFGNKEKRLERRAARKTRRLQRRNSPKRLARKQKRKDFFKKVGKAYEDLGGGTAIGGAIDTLVSKKPQIVASTTEPSDFQVDVGVNDDTKKDNTLQTVIYISLGVLVVGGIAVLATRSSKNQYMPIQN